MVTASVRRERIRRRCTLDHAFMLGLRLAAAGDWTPEARLSLMALRLALWPSGIGGPKS